MAGTYMRQLLAVSFHTMLMQLYWVCILCSLKSFFFFALLRETFLLMLNVFCLFEFLFFFIIFLYNFLNVQSSCLLILLFIFLLLYFHISFLFLKAFDFLFISLGSLQVIDMYTTSTYSDLWGICTETLRWIPES